MTNFQLRITNEERNEYEAFKKDYFKRYPDESLDDMALVMYFARKNWKQEAEDWKDAYRGIHAYMWGAMAAAVVATIIVLAR